MLLKGLFYKYSQSQNRLRRQKHRQGGALVMPKRGENIYKRKDGRWEGRYIRGRTASGQAEYGYVYADSYKACRAKRQQCIETLPEKPAVQASAATLAQAAELFLSEKSHVLKASSWNRYSYVKETFWNDIIIKTPLSCPRISCRQRAPRKQLPPSNQQTKTRFPLYSFFPLCARCLL